MNEIHGNAKSIRTLLSAGKYAIDDYQREYLWEEKQIIELINDLTEKFSENHETGNDRSKVMGYDRYFLGSIIICDKDGHKYIIDGQQRLTSLTLLLIYIHRQFISAQKEDEANHLTALIYSQQYGKKSFNLDIQEREPCMEALLKDKPFDDSRQPESVANIFQRYRDIEEHFPKDILDDEIPFFADWLIDNVFLVEITTSSNADAYTIFETMNDRGLSLSSTDMFKSYLLANITESDDLRKEANETWKAHIANLQEIGKKEDASAIKAWLRSRYAESIRANKRGAKPRDFELIGSEFHRWVRDKKNLLGLSSSEGFGRFIREDFAFYANQYKKIREKSKQPTEGLEAIHFNAEHEFTLQYPMLLAPLKRDDSNELILRKLRIVSSYVDIYINRRIWNGKSIGYSTVQYAMFSVIKEIRMLEPEGIIYTLVDRLKKEENTFANNNNFKLTRTNSKRIRRILTRMIDYIETRSGQASRYAEYAASGKNGYEIEHIWSTHWDQHSEEFERQSDFDEYRDRIGGLLLLPKSFNASYKDSPYSHKLDHYNGQNLLARSLHPLAYENNPGFQRFLDESELDFRPHEQFKKADLDARQSLYQKLAEKIWDPDNLLREAKR